MSRRSSAFESDLAELDTLQSLPLPPVAPASEPPPAPTSVRPAPPSRPKLEARTGTSVPAQAASPAHAAGDASAGTRATQVRLPPHLAAWLSEEAHRTKKTLSTVVALAARDHRKGLPVRREDTGGLDVSRRVASGTVPVTLRLTGAQRALLDEIAAELGVTRSAVVVAAVAAVAA